MLLCRCFTLYLSNQWMHNHHVGVYLLQAFIERSGWVTPLRNRCNYCRFIVLFPGSFILPSRELKPILPLKRDKFTFSSKSLKGGAEIEILNRIKLKMSSQPLTFLGEDYYYYDFVCPGGQQSLKSTGVRPQEMRGNIQLFLQSGKHTGLPTLFVVPCLRDLNKWSSKGCRLDSERAKLIRKVCSRMSFQGEMFGNKFDCGCEIILK